MKRFLIWALIAALALSALPASCLAAGADSGGGILLLREGETLKLAAKLGGAPLARVRWKSSDEGVVTAAKRKIVARDPGLARLAASYGGRTIRRGVVVLPKRVNLKVGEKLSLPRGGGEKYSVKNPAVARVGKKGVITGRKAGSTRVTVTLGSQKRIVKVKVSGEGQPEAPKESDAAELDCADEAKQIVLVDYKGGSKATLSIHEKQSGLWKQLYSCAAYVGRNGIGKAREGDGKTPTGTYNLTQPFGIKADPGAKMEYTKVTKYHYWCGSSGSSYYNQLVDEREVSRKHTSSDEYLINYKGVYNYCMFIDYNAKGEAGKGSCIFLHCKGSKNSTSGCIAVDEAVMKKLIQWAKPGCKIVIR